MTLDAVSDGGEFNVVQFNADGTYHYVERWLGRREALMLAWHCFRRQEGKSGPINRIIITDRGDFTVFEWKRRSRHHLSAARSAVTRRTRSFSRIRRALAVE